MEQKVINAIIVDDENGSIENTKYYLAKLCKEIKVIATGNTLKEAMNRAGEQNIDLAFLDVELFDDNIFDALANADDIHFKIVFVTAHERYALKAIKTEALDYLLKPLAEDDILACYAKAKKYFLPDEAYKDEQIHEGGDKKRAKIILKSSDKVYVIRPDDIYYISGRGFYSDITFTFNNEMKTLVVSKPLNKAETEYDHPSFFRAHKSYIINTGKIQDVIKNTGGTSVKMMDGHTVPVAKRREHEFLLFLNTRH